MTRTKVLFVVLSTLIQSLRTTGKGTSDVELKRIISFTYDVFAVLVYSGTRCRRY